LENAVILTHLWFSYLLCSSVSICQQAHLVWQNYAKFCWDILILVYFIWRDTSLTARN